MFYKELALFFVPTLGLTPRDRLLCLKKPLRLDDSSTVTSNLSIVFSKVVSEKGNTAYVEMGLRKTTTTKFHCRLRVTYFLFAS